MHKSTIFFFIKKIMGKDKKSDADKLVYDGINELSEPSEQSIKNIMAFSNAYRYQKSENIGKVDYIIN